MSFFYLFTVSNVAVDACQLFRRLWLNAIHPTAKPSEEENRNCTPRNTMAQLSTPYTDPERHNTLRYRQTCGQTDRRRYHAIAKRVNTHLT